MNRYYRKYLPYVVFFSTLLVGAVGILASVNLKSKQVEETDVKVVDKLLSPEASEIREQDNNSSEAFKVVETEGDDTNTNTNADTSADIDAVIVPKRKDNPVCESISVTVDSQSEEDVLTPDTKVNITCTAYDPRVGNTVEHVEFIMFDINSGEVVSKLRCPSLDEDEHTCVFDRMDDGDAVPKVEVKLQGYRFPRSGEFRAKVKVMSVDASGNEFWGE